MGVEIALAPSDLLLFLRLSVYLSPDLFENSPTHFQPIFSYVCTSDVGLIPCAPKITGLLKTSELLLNFSKLETFPFFLLKKFQWRHLRCWVDFKQKVVNL